MYLSKKKDRTFISLDLGTANIIAYIADQGVVFNEPSMIAYDNNTNEIVAVGIPAYNMSGKQPPNIRIVRPLLEGVVADMDAVIDLLKYVFKKLKLLNAWHKSIVLLACPSGITMIERIAIKNIAFDMGASIVVVEEETKMAAIGAGINIDMPKGHLVIDIGGGTTDASIISSGETIISKSIKIAGQQIDNEIYKYIRGEYNIAVGFRTAEELKKALGSLQTYAGEARQTIYGRDIVTGLPRGIQIKASEIRNIMLNSFSRIVDMIIEVLEATPPQLTGDIIENGITITGGGALIKKLDTYLNTIFNLKTRIAKNPLLCVIEGTKEYQKRVRLLILKGVYKENNRDEQKI